LVFDDILSVDGNAEFSLSICYTMMASITFLLFHNMVKRANNISQYDYACMHSYAYNNNSNGYICVPNTPSNICYYQLYSVDLTCSDL
jgi:hypothetical protein